MKLRTLITFFLMLALQTASAAQSPASIEGVVRDAATNQPVAGVRLSLEGTTTYLDPRNPRTPVPEVLSDSQGRFSLQTSETGRFRLVPTRDGYISVRPGQTRPAAPGVWVQLAPGLRVQNLELQMARPAVISGRIVDADGKVYGPDRVITLMIHTYGSDGKRGLDWVPGFAYPGIAGSRQRTNDQGEFRLYDVPPGEYYLSVYGGGTIDSSGSYFFPGGVEEAKATPIRVIGGEDLRLGTLTMPPIQKGVEVRLRITGAGEYSTPSISLGDRTLIYAPAPPQNPNEPVLRLMPGRYETVVTNGLSDLRYGSLTLEVGNTNLEANVELKPGVRITGKVLLENEGGQRAEAPRSIFCNLRSKYGSSNCAGSGAVPGLHHLDVQRLPPDAYVLSAKAGDHDVLLGGLNITGDVEVEVVLATPGAIVQGVVRTATGETLPGAIVAVVPDAPYREVSLRYRSVVTDRDGKFEVHGIAPGTYKVFAWPELEGAAYRNAEFMKEFEARGKPVKVEKGVRQTVELTAFQ